jgi:S-ribosylhomocysteine lyase LuxS involved in autoinducer biosynthesis
MTSAADKVSQNKLMSNAYVHHLEHIPTSNIRQPIRNQKHVINRNPSCAVTVQSAALCSTKKNYTDRVYYVRQSHKTTKWLETNCIPANRALRTIWFQKLQTGSQFNNVFLQQATCTWDDRSTKKITLFMKPGGSLQSSKISPMDPTLSQLN